MFLWSSECQTLIHFGLETIPNTTVGLVVLSAMTVCIMFPLAYIKFHIGRKVNSIALKKDALCSLAVALISLGICITASIYSQHQKVWWLDPTLALVIALGLTGYGAFTLIHSICTRQYWFKSSFWKS